jgi:hypothetical protein
VTGRGPEAIGRPFQTMAGEWDCSIVQAHQEWVKAEAVLKRFGSHWDESLWPELPATAAARRNAEKFGMVLGLLGGMARDQAPDRSTARRGTAMTTGRMPPGSSALYCRAGRAGP